MKRAVLNWEVGEVGSGKWVKWVKWEVGEVGIDWFDVRSGLRIRVGLLTDPASSSNPVSLVYAANCDVRTRDLLTA
ncbi:MAG: hypothetical protein P8L85_11350 [Rubripirellula sp.]|nr:hypothetical protein [Rubripirellula sp.]